jgi:hypothetical protein
MRTIAAAVMIIIIIISAAVIIIILLCHVQVFLVSCIVYLYKVVVGSVRRCFSAVLHASGKSGLRGLVLLVTSFSL